MEINKGTPQSLATFSMASLGESNWWVTLGSSTVLNQVQTSRFVSRSLGHEYFQDAGLSTW
jgi:hypothetical protein